MPALDAAQIRHFMEAGFVRVDGAFPRALAARGGRYLWRDTGCAQRPGDVDAPVIRLGDYAQEPFRRAVNTPRLLGAFDELVGAGRWLPRGSLGTFPIRFPSSTRSGRRGLARRRELREAPDGEWRVNVASRGRALLMLFLFSDVGEADAPTRIRVGSHLDVAQLLAPAGERGLEFMELAQRSMPLPNGPWRWPPAKRARCICVIRSWCMRRSCTAARGRPRFLAQPPLLPARAVAPGRIGGKPVTGGGRDTAGPARERSSPAGPVGEHADGCFRLAPCSSSERCSGSTCVSRWTKPSRCIAQENTSKSSAGIRSLRARRSMGIGNRLLLAAPAGCGLPEPPS